MCCRYFQEVNRLSFFVWFESSAAKREVTSHFIFYLIHLLTNARLAQSVLISESWVQAPRWAIAYCFCCSLEKKNKNTERERRTRIS